MTPGPEQGAAVSPADDGWGGRGKNAARWAWVVVAAYGLAMCVYVVWRAERSTDFRDFWENARALLETGRIRSDLGVHNYLPVFTILMAPWGLLPLEAAMVAFTVLSLACLVAAGLLLRGCLRGAGQPLVDRALLVALWLIAPYVHSTLTLGAVNCILLLLIVAAWAACQRRREWLAGGLLGLAIVIKLLPALLLGYLLLARRARAAAAAALVAGLLGVGLPLLVLGWDGNVEAHRAFQVSAARHSFRDTLLSDKPIKANYSNVALPITLRRLTSPVNAAKGDAEWHVNAVDLPRRVILSIYLAIVAFLGLATLVMTVKAPGGLFGSAAVSGVSSSASAVADLALLGAWCALMLLASPLVWTHYLMLCAPALAALLLSGGACGPASRSRCVARRAVLPIWLLAALLLAWPQARAAGAPLLAVGMVWWAALRVSAGDQVRIASRDR